MSESAFLTVQPLARELMDKNGELLSRREFGEYMNASAARHTMCWRNLCVVCKGISDASKGRSAALCSAAGRLYGGELGKRIALCLALIEDVGGTKAEYTGLFVLAVFRFDSLFTTTGARIMMPFSPFRTCRPSLRHVWKPATRVAVGRCDAMSRALLQLYWWNRPITAR